MKNSIIIVAHLIIFVVGINNCLQAQTKDSTHYVNPVNIPDTVRVPPTKYTPDTGGTKLQGGALIDTVTTKNKRTIFRPEHEGKPDSIPRLN
jgi:hypothetical protein